VIEKRVLEPAGRPTVAYSWTLGWYGEGGDSLLAASFCQEQQEAPGLTQADMDRTSLHKWGHSYRKQRGIAFSHGGWEVGLLNVTCSRKTKVLQMSQTAMGQSCSKTSME